METREEKIKALLGVFDPQVTSIAIMRKIYEGLSDRDIDMRFSNLQEIKRTDTNLEIIWKDPEPPTM